MSTEPVGLGRTAVDVIKEKWANVEIRKELYCSYSGCCKVDRTIQGLELCMWCGYRQPIDIPELIKRSKCNG